MASPATVAAMAGLPRIVTSRQMSKQLPNPPQAVGVLDAPRLYVKWHPRQLPQPAAPTAS